MHIKKDCFQNVCLDSKFTILKSLVILNWSHANVRLEKSNFLKHHSLLLWAIVITVKRALSKQLNKLKTIEHTHCKFHLKLLRITGTRSKLSKIYTTKLSRPTQGLSSKKQRSRWSKLVLIGITDLTKISRRCIPQIVLCSQGKSKPSLSGNGGTRPYLQSESQT